MIGSAESHWLYPLSYYLVAQTKDGCLHPKHSSLNHSTVGLWLERATVCQTIKLNQPCTCRFEWRLATPRHFKLLRTDASARHSRRLRFRRSRSAVSLRPSSASCLAGTQQTHASSAGSGGGGEVHPLAGRSRPVVVTDSVEARLR